MRPTPHKRMRAEVPGLHALTICLRWNSLQAACGARRGGHLLKVGVRQVGLAAQHVHAILRAQLCRTERDDTLQMVEAPSGSHLPHNTAKVTTGNTLWVLESSHGHVSNSCRGSLRVQGSHWGLLGLAGWRNQRQSNPHVHGRTLWVALFSSSYGSTSLPGTYLRFSATRGGFVGSATKGLGVNGCRTGNAFSLKAACCKLQKLGCLEVQETDANSVMHAEGR